MPTVLLAGYGAGQVAGQVFRDTPSLILLFFMTNALGVNAALAGVAIFFPKFLWGVLCDLAVGIASDRLRKSIPRHTWLLAGAALAPIAMIALFRVPGGSELFRATYVAIVFGFYMLVFSIFSVPYLALGAEISADSGERTVLMAWRQVFAGFGILMSITVAPILVQRLGARQSAYETTSVVLAVACLAGLLVAWQSVSRIARRSALVPATTAPALRLASLAGVLRNRNFLVLVATAFIQLVGSGMSYAAVAYFLTYNAQRADALALLGVINLVSIATVTVAQPLFVALSKRTSKRNIYMACAVGHALTQLAWVLTPGAPAGVFYVYGLFYGLFNSGYVLMLICMLTDLMAQDRASGDQERSGVYSALWAAVDKIAFALGGTLLTGLILAGFGFDSASATTGGAQPDSVFAGIAIVFAFLPAILNVLAAMVIGYFGRLGTAGVAS